MFKGAPDPFAQTDPPIPFWEEFNYTERFPSAARPIGELTRAQRVYFLLYAEIKDAEIEERRRAAKR